MASSHFEVKSDSTAEMLITMDSARPHFSLELIAHRQMITITPRKIKFFLHSISSGYIVEDLLSMTQKEINNAIREYFEWSDLVIDMWPVADQINKEQFYELMSSKVLANLFMNEYCKGLDKDRLAKLFALYAPYGELSFISVFHISQLLTSHTFSKTSKDEPQNAIDLIDFLYRIRVEAVREKNIKYIQDFSYSMIEDYLDNISGHPEFLQKSVLTLSKPFRDKEGRWHGVGFNLSFMEPIQLPNGEWKRHIHVLVKTVDKSKKLYILCGPDGKEYQDIKSLKEALDKLPKMSQEAIKKRLEAVVWECCSCCRANTCKDSRCPCGIPQPANLICNPDSYHARRIGYICFDKKCEAWNTTGDVCCVKCSEPLLPHVIQKLNPKIAVRAATVPFPHVEAKSDETKAMASFTFRPR